MTMQITRLRVEQLRQFRQPFELTGFEPGLNLFCGPNEAGKSTLVRAIRAAFFERHRSTAVDDLRPWGDSAAAPTIELDFLLAGQPMHLVKSFLGRKRCSLRTHGRTYEGVEAEDHLASLFGFAFAAKGASRPEHWGIPGLLWVDQGTGQDLDVSHAQDHLHDALASQAAPDGSATAPATLERATAGLAATGGDDLLERLRAQRAELLTATGKPRAALAEAIDRAANLAADHQALLARVAAYREQVDQLATLRAQHDTDETRRPWEPLQAALAQARAQEQALQSTQQQLAGDTARLAQLTQTRELLTRQLNDLAEQQAVVRAREQALAAAVSQCDTARAAVHSARQQAEAAQAQALQARDALRRAREARSRHDLREQLAQAEDSTRQAAEALARADADHARLNALQAQAAAVRIDPRAVTRVVQLQRTERELELQRQAVATRLGYRLLPGQSLTLSGADGPQQLQAKGERLIDTAVTLTLPGVGDLTITPGGQDLAELARRHRDAQAELQQALQALGVADPAQAEARAAAQNELNARIAMAEQALAIVAPKGLDALRLQHTQAGARQRSIQQALDQLPPEAEAAPTATHTALPDPAQAEAAQHSADTLAQAAATALAGAERQLAAAQGRHDDARREYDAALSRLNDPERQARQTEAQQQLLALQAEQDALAARIEQARARLHEARPEIVAQDIVRLQRSIEQLEAAHRQRRERLLLLQQALQQEGAHGLEEQLATLEGELARARRREQELQRRAAALDLLCSRLDAGRQAVMARLQRPLRQRLQHYLELLFPGAQLEVTASLAPATLSRPGGAGAQQTATVEALSFGAREQLGLISRLAYADLLREAGRPTLLILDDALVHSDDKRLAQMKRVLFDASQRHQVLLFTCHPERWQDLGVAPRSIV